MMGPRICQKSPCDSKNRKYLACFLDRQYRTSDLDEDTRRISECVVVQRVRRPPPCVEQGCWNPQDGVQTAGLECKQMGSVDDWLLARPESFRRSVASSKFLPAAARAKEQCLTMEHERSQDAKDFGKR